PADRLDSELLSLNDPVAVLIDIVDHHRDRHLTLYGSGVAVGYLILRSSSAAAKKAADVRSISFARRNSRFSRSNRARRSFTSVGTPGRLPASTSAVRTQLRSASVWMSSCVAMRRIAP